MQSASARSSTAFRTERRWTLEDLTREAHQPKGRARKGTNGLFGGKRRVGTGMRADSRAASRYFDRFRAARHLFIVAMETGIRREDVRLLSWRAVRFDEGVIRFRMRKTQKLVEVRSRSAAVKRSSPRAARHGRHRVRDACRLPVFDLDAAARVQDCEGDRW